MNFHDWILKLIEHLIITAVLWILCVYNGTMAMLSKQANSCSILQFPNDDPI